MNIWFSVRIKKFLLQFFMVPDIGVRVQFKLREKKVRVKVGKEKFYLSTITMKFGIQ